MGIKRSLLESKWYYRTGKTFVLLLPVLIVIYAYGMGFISFDWVFQKDVLQIIAANNIFVGEIIVSFVVYYVFVNILSRIIFYIVFGGIEEDRPIQKAAATGATSVPQKMGETSEGIAQYIDDQNKHRGEFILWVIFIICILLVAFYGNSHSSFVPGAPNPSPKCVSTGCGTLWRCNGGYYDGGVKKSINGCYTSNTQVTSLPSWSGTCRRCP